MRWSAYLPSLSITECGLHLARPFQALTPRLFAAANSAPLAEEFRHPSIGIRDAHQLVGRNKWTRNSDTDQLVGRSNRPEHRLSKRRGGPIWSSSRRSSRVSDHLAGEVERDAPSRRPRTRLGAPGGSAFNGHVVLGGLNGITRGIVAGRENPSPSQGDLVVGPRNSQKLRWRRALLAPASDRIHSLR